MIAGMDEVPGGSHNAIPDAPTIAVFGAFRVMNMFAVLAPVYVFVAVACFAMADGLSRGLRWACRAHVVLGWLGLAVVAGYGALYWFSTYAPRAGLLVVAGSAAVPAAMIRAGLAPREGSGPTPRRRRLGGSKSGDSQEVPHHRVEHDSKDHGGAGQQVFMNL